MYILNVAAGKEMPLRKLKKDDFLVNLDMNYFNSEDSKNIENLHLKKINKKNNYSLNEKPDIHYCNHDVYDFLERYTQQFDIITMYRFLEHVPKVKLLYFLYILSTVVKIGGMVEVIVPDYRILAKRILSEQPFDINFESEDIITTFELLNEPYCAHASIWTPDRAKYFFELEGRFSIEDMEEDFLFDGRNLYLKFIAVRIK